MKSGVCPKCQSQNIIRGARVDALGDSVSLVRVSVLRARRSLFFPRRASRVRAWMCGDCGYMELYADEPGRLAEEARKRRSQRRSS
jgi:predicted nucleic-acid-binding Zn-ribbon protein